MTPQLLAKMATDAEDEWMHVLEQQEAAAKMPLKVLRNHLTLLGWVPVAATREALQRDTERVYITELPDRLSVVHYTHPHALKRTETPWSAIPHARLIMLAKKIVSLP